MYARRISLRSRLWAPLRQYEGAEGSNAARKDGEGCALISLSALHPSVLPEHAAEIAARIVDMARLLGGDQSECHGRALPAHGEARFTPHG
jgi:hypothetical protein